MPIKQGVQKMAQFKPARYFVFCSVPSTDPRNKTGIYTFRVGMTNHVDKIAEIIANDRKSARNTFGGLLDAPEGKRTYSAFEAEWAQLEGIA